MKGKGKKKKLNFKSSGVTNNYQCYGINMWRRNTLNALNTFYFLLIIKMRIK
jgi:hypothetical protein